METMERMKRIMTRLSLSNLEVGSFYWVEVTYVNSPDSFFVRPLQYRTYMSVLQARGEHMDASEINVGTVVIFKSTTVRSNVRGRVISIEGDTEPKYNLHALDYGCYEKSVPLESIWSPLAKLDLPSSVIRCQLADCAPRRDVWDDRAIEAMRKHVMGETAKILVRGKSADVNIVELFNSGPDDIGTLLIITGHACVGLVRNHYPRQRAQAAATQNYYSPRDLYVSKVMNVQLLSGSTEYGFYVTPVNEYKSYIENLDIFRYDVLAEKPISPDNIKANRPIAVYHDNADKFERALIKEAFPTYNTARVHLVDWGVEIIVPYSNLKNIPELYKHMPAKAIYCTLHERQLRDKNTKHFSNSGSKFEITFEQIGTNDSPNIVAISPTKGILDAFKWFLEFPL